jgi:hypothetical protein
VPLKPYHPGNGNNEDLADPLPTLSRIASITSVTLWGRIKDFQSLLD